MAQHNSAFGMESRVLFLIASFIQKWFWSIEICGGASINWELGKIKQHGYLPIIFKEFTETLKSYTSIQRDSSSWEIIKQGSKNVCKIYHLWKIVRLKIVKKKEKDHFSCKRFFKVTSHPLITFFPFQNNSQNSFIHYTTYTNCKTCLILYFRIHATSAIITSVVVQSCL